MSVGTIGRRGTGGTCSGGYSPPAGPTAAAAGTNHHVSPRAWRTLARLPVVAPSLVDLAHSGRTTPRQCARARRPLVSIDVVKLSLGRAW